MGKINRICPLCKQEGELRESHIIPYHAYKQLKLIKNKQASHYLFNPKSGELEASEIENGVTDQDLLCKDCEQFLNDEYENYCSQLVFQKPPLKWQLTNETINDPLYGKVTIYRKCRLLQIKTLCFINVMACFYF